MCSSFQMPRSPGVMRPSGVDGVGFRDDEAGTANGAAAKVDKVPVVGEAVYCGVFAH